jgi:hypothetical protein
MVTVHREAGFRFVIYVDDHEPAHVHVENGGNAKIEIAGDRPKLMYSRGMSGGDLRKAMLIVAEQQTAMLARWREFHG